MYGFQRMAEKGELIDQPQEAHLTTDAPPSYSEATVSYGWSVGNLEQTGKDRRSLVDQIVVTLKEVNTAIAQNAPGTVLTPEQKETIKRLTESILKRNVREQGVLPTALQREITLAHVVTKFNRTRFQDSSASPQVSQPISTTSSQQLPITTSRQLSLPTEAPTSSLANGPSTVVTPQPADTGRQVNGHNPARRNSFSSVVVSDPQPANTGRQVNSHNLRQNRVIIGTWLTYSVNNGPSRPIHAYSDRLQGAIIFASVLLVISFFLGTPLSLVVTVPTLHWILKVHVCSSLSFKTVSHTLYFDHNVITPHTIGLFLIVLV